MYEQYVRFHFLVQGDWVHGVVNVLLTLLFLWPNCFVCADYILYLQSSTCQWKVFSPGLSKLMLRKIDVLSQLVYPTTEGGYICLNLVAIM